MPITSYITLTTGVKRVDIYTEAENHARSHFLRAAFPVAVELKPLWPVNSLAHKLAGL